MWVVHGIGGVSVATRVTVYWFGPVSSGVTFAKNILVVMFLFLRC